VDTHSRLLDYRDTDASIHGRKATVLFQEAVEHYRKQGGSRRFLGEYDERTDAWSGLIGRFWNRKLSTITQGDLDDASIALYPNANHHTRNRQCHTPFIAVWNKAHEKGWCEKRDWKRPRKAKGTMLKFKSKKTRAGTTATTYNRAWQFVSAMSPAPAVIMTTFFYTGMRPIELYTLEAGQVSVEDRWIFLPESKTGEPRGIPMHEMLLPLFAGLKKRGGFLFRTPRGKPYEPKDEEGQGGGQIKSAINGARRRSGIFDIAPYTGRHTVQTQLLMNGTQQAFIDDIVGHARDESDMRRRYIHIPQPNLIAEINKLPVIKEWAEAPWMCDPLAWASKLIEGTGERTDLKLVA
jgi:integrase/recombinase XerD